MSSSPLSILLSTSCVSQSGTLDRTRPVKEQPPADMHDDKTDTIPLPSLSPSIPCPDSDRCDTGGVSVNPLKRSTPVINRFHPVLVWRTILQLLTCRSTESIAFSVPDRNALWSRSEDDLLVQVVAKYSTSHILGRDWREVASELPGRLPR